MNQSTNSVFVAGWGQLPEALAPLAECVAGESELISVSQLGLADAKNLAFPYASELERLLEFKASPANVVGWSMGGIVSLQLALKRPELFDSLVLLSSTACFCNLDDYSCGVPPERVRAMRQMLQVDTRGMLSRFFEAVYDDASIRQKKIEQALSIETAELVRGLLYLEKTDLRADLPRLSVSTLLLHGTVDTIIKPEAAEFISSRVRNSKLHLYADAGHDLLVNRLAAVSDEITGFTNDC